MRILILLYLLSLMPGQYHPVRVPRVFVTNPR